MTTLATPAVAAAVLAVRPADAAAAEWDSGEQAALDAVLAKLPPERHPPLER